MGDDLPPWCPLRISVCFTTTDLERSRGPALLSIVDWIWASWHNIDIYCMEYMCACVILQRKSLSLKHPYFTIHPFFRIFGSSFFKSWTLHRSQNVNPENLATCQSSQLPSLYRRLNPAGPR